MIDFSREEQGRAAPIAGVGEALMKCRLPSVIADGTSRV
jgi:hypothetical protein